MEGGLARDFRRIDPATARIVLIEAGERVLPSFPPRLSQVAAAALRRLGVELRLGAELTACDDRGVTVGGERIESHTLIWAAGVAACPTAFWLGVAPSRAGRVAVNPDLTVPGHAEIFVIGDTAQIDGPHGPLPGMAPVAKQEGAYEARSTR